MSNRRTTRTTRALGLVLAGTAALSVALPATASAAQTSGTTAAASCYDGSVGISLPANGYSREFTTTSRCADINLRIDSGGGQWVAVCWAAHGSCQSSWTWVPQGGGYHVVASDVKNGTKFYFTTTNGGGTRHGRAAF
ncbi:hypothetical protein LE181_31450 [Streptomyces sp. SCA3-4]|uniref:hypothetical protein n=1 Tax=Streptomyces sichuanensis TaxID=2871810 RepID=UPI001CE3046F|nr:hypothetical protein [Streptomyces sichuanensis]MCA6096661.1 hypothetical protein [Streptomyces sichuanensis]